MMQGKNKGQGYNVLSVSLTFNQKPQNVSSAKAEYSSGRVVRSSWSPPKQFNPEVSNSNDQKKDRFTIYRSTMELELEYSLEFTLLGMINALNCLK